MTAPWLAPDGEEWFPPYRTVGYPFVPRSYARIEAQQRLADMQELAAKAELAHRMAVQRYVQEAVAEAVAAEREACEERVVSLFEVLEKPYLPDIARAIHARDKA